MPRLIWTPGSLAALARLHAFLNPRDPDAARRAVAAIRKSARLLEEHPQAGRPVAEMDSGFRECPVSFGAGGYIVLYRLEDRQAVILAVRHGRELGY